MRRLIIILVYPDVEEFIDTHVEVFLNGVRPRGEQ
jgi:hypothetical protein